MPPSAISSARGSIKTPSSVSTPTNRMLNAPAATSTPSPAPVTAAIRSGMVSIGSAATPSSPRVSRRVPERAPASAKRTVISW